MFHYIQHIRPLVVAAGLLLLTGCIVESGRYNASGSPSSGAQNASNYDRGCADAKAGSYDRSGNADQAYESGWNACKSGSGQQQNGAQNAAEYDRGCADAKAGSYDRSGNAGQAYENGWKACHQ